MAVYLLVYPAGIGFMLRVTRQYRKDISCLLVGALFLLPIILLYTGWSYWVFRGEVFRTDSYQ